MKKNKIILGSIIFAAGLVSLNTGCAPKQDYIKINNVRYDFQGVALSKNEVIVGISDRLTLKADLEGFDKDGIKELYCYVDGNYYNNTDILYWITEGKLDNFRPEDVKKLDREIEIRPATYKNHPEFEKGNHTLKVILEDLKGNKLEDSYVFEVKR